MGFHAIENLFISPSLKWDNGGNQINMSSVHVPFVHSTIDLFGKKRALLDLNKMKIFVSTSLIVCLTLFLGSKTTAAATSGSVFMDHAGLLFNKADQQKPIAEGRFSDNLNEWLSGPWMGYIASLATIWISIICTWIVIYTGDVFPNGVPGVGRNLATSRQQRDIDDLTNLILPALFRWVQDS